ncbi:MAG: hypothetical protein DWQ07_22895 [Chloroflexi bacterium]|nr:MAG: hypothetical protein DWQ07_22895 [Chloroflexota bacterium]MBL1193997.1 hypothetical protein [Chloroflexota bacterium]NOH11291.1 AAA family ATPase [Chloroflexota bacterium]
MLILLIGPKGSGKSHIGRTIEKHLGVHFFLVEPHWMDYYAKCEAAGRQPTIPGGIAQVHPMIKEALHTHQHVCVETTGASQEILDDLLSLEPGSNTLIARISVPLELCLERIAQRDQTEQIQMDIESIRTVYELSEALQIEADLTIENVELTEKEITDLFKSAISDKLE